ncbi:Retrovirus-related Pol polyprotein from transposon RE1 [Sesamum angolense]|uniref:Retrovirus-related Pol polyprotein from transposon RE1 n=1 Tax=Sesamum angolense TaxID=2727404 RepID=A0AAE1T9Z8_9LAMI|nr:Retrovirus-related Pol polyprotein from transposon RE1 [Sesamum angolense]
MKSLNSLDFSRNHLSGGIPTSICDLDSLGSLDLSYNNLSGRIPQDNHCLTFGGPTYIGNVGLCGPLLNKSCPGDEPIEDPNSTVDAQGEFDDDDDDRIELSKARFWRFFQTREEALRAKMKLGFIDGTTMKPHSTDLFFEQWIRVDSMVTTWILNCISKEIVGSFMYAKSARTLWLDLEERDQATFTRLIQFLMGLSETFDHLRDQLLVMDPVPTVNKAYSMVLRVEKQREVNVDYTNTMDNAAMQVPKQEALLQELDLQTKSVIAIGKLYKNLYILDKSSFSLSTKKSFTAQYKSCANFISCNNVLWHRRLGHPSLSVLKHVPDVKSIDTSTTCMVCPLAKQSRLPFSTCEIHSKNPFELIHVDLWGPYKTPTLDGCNYFLTVVDDFSRATWTFLLRYKTQKFDARAHKCVFLGYSQTHKAYKVLNLDTNLSFFSRDVNFHEDIFPFHSVSTSGAPKSVSLLPLYSADSYDDITPPTSTPAINPTVPSTPPTSTPAINPTVPSTPELPTATDTITHSPQFPSNSRSVPVYVPPPRRSLRTVQKPAWLDDYVCQCASNSNHTCLPSNYTSTHMLFVALLSSIQEPRSYLEASKDARWVDAMNEELTALDKNETWELASLPPGKKAIGCKWVFKVKLHPDGSVHRYKARLVAKGYNQVEGIDYFDSFSPVAKSVTVRVFMAVAVAKGWPLWQLDVNNAFLHGHLDEEVYMVPPEGYTCAVPGRFCRLKRSLYGLKQASRQWNIELTTKLQDFGYVQCPHDHCLFLKITSTCFVGLLVYVDDIILTGNSEDEIASVKSYLHSLFTIKDLGFAKYFLGLELARSTHGLLVTQQKYLTDILSDTNLLGAKPTSTPFPPGLKLTAGDGSLLSDPAPYRRLVGRLLYLGFTRPDISFVVQQLSQFLQHPRSSHWDAALHVLRYLKGTSSLGLFFSSCNSLQPSVFTDASWASCPDSRRSITGFCIFLGSTLVSWKTKKQATVS